MNGAHCRCTITNNEDHVIEMGPTGERVDEWYWHDWLQEKMKCATSILCIGPRMEQYYPTTRVIPPGHHSITGQQRHSSIIFPSDTVVCTEQWWITCYYCAYIIYLYACYIHIIPHSMAVSLHRQPSNRTCPRMISFSVKWWCETVFSPVHFSPSIHSLLLYIVVLSPPHILPVLVLMWMQSIHIHSIHSPPSLGIMSIPHRIVPHPTPVCEHPLRMQPTS